MYETSKGKAGMTPLPHSTFELTNWLRERYPEVLKEYTTEKDAEWEKKVCGPYGKEAEVNVDISRRRTLTRISYLKSNGEVYRFEEFQTPPPEKVQPIPTDDDYGNMVYLAEEMGLDEEVIKNMEGIKRKIQNA